MKLESIRTNYYVYLYFQAIPITYGLPSRYQGHRWCFNPVGELARLFPNLASFWESLPKRLGSSPTIGTRTLAVPREDDLTSLIQHKEPRHEDSDPEGVDITTTRRQCGTSASQQVGSQDVVCKV